MSYIITGNSKFSTIPFYSAIIPNADNKSIAGCTLLKAVLAYKKVDIPKTHDLGLLLILTGLREGEMGLKVDDIAELSGYCVEARYPADLPLLSAQDAMKAVEVVKKVIVRFFRF
ncbi:MAG: HEPN domain-containing protein [bacterium]|nr:HEPN domain-containing protein [bacterium]